MKPLFALLLALPTLSFAQGTSFHDLKKLVYENPRSDLPAYQGLQTWDVLSNLLGSEDKPTHGLSIRSRQILVDEADTRKPEPKWLHPRGACAEARWIITEPSPATGMFAAGVNVPAIVRLSSGDAASEFPTDGRIFGLAVKIFPTTDPNQKVKTANIITLDQFGFERSSRKYVFNRDKSQEPIYFSNVAPAKSALGKFLSQFFDRFDNPNFARPLYATAAAHLGGGELIDRVTPYEIRFVAEAKRPTILYSDFRKELLADEKRAFRIVLQSFNGRDQIAQPIGRLELGKFVVSDFCDLGLQFHHSPLEDQWAKYTDYEAVRGLE